MIQENLAVVAASFAKDAERALLYPRLGGYAQVNIQSENRIFENESSSGGNDTTKTVLKTYYDVSLAQHLFHWGSIQAQADIARIRFEIAERNYREAYQLLANEIRDAYLRLVVARVAQRNRGLELARATHRLTSLRQRVEEGSVTAGDVSAQEAVIAAMELAGDRADYGLVRALQQFQRLTGRPELTIDDVPETLVAPAPVESAHTLPLRSDYVSRRYFGDSLRYFNAERDLEIQKRTIKITSNALKPKFDLVAGLSQDEVDRSGTAVDKYQLATTYAGVRINWAIFDSKRTRSLVRAAQARLRRSELALTQLELDLVESIDQSETELGFLTRSLKVAERNFTSAQNSYNSAVNFHKEGRFSQEDVDAAQSALRAAEHSVSETRRLYLRSVAEFLGLVQADPLIERMMAEGLFFR